MIKLDENFMIKPDYYSWVLKYRKTIIKDGKEVVSKDKWYFPKLSDCLRKYVQQSLKSSETLDDIQNRLARIDEKIDSIKNDLFIREHQTV